MLWFILFITIINCSIGFTSTFMWALGALMLWSIISLIHEATNHTSHMDAFGWIMLLIISFLMFTGDANFIEWFLILLYVLLLCVFTFGEDIEKK